MKRLSIYLLILLSGINLSRADEEPIRYYKGAWNTTNRPLDGEMKCIVRQNGKNYTGKFYGIWEGVSYEYSVKWKEEKHSILSGDANIDGAIYKWSGRIKDGKFIGNFKGRYLGSFELKEYTK